MQDSNYAATQYIGKTGVERKGAFPYTEKLAVKQSKSMLKVTVSCEWLIESHQFRGDDLRLTIDSGLQIKAYSLLKGLNKLTGSIVALDVRNGGVLTMVNFPSFDPNAFSSGISPEPIGLDEFTLSPFI